MAQSLRARNPRPSSSGVPNRWRQPPAPPTDGREGFVFLGLENAIQVRSDGRAGAKPLPATLDRVAALRPSALLPGRGAALTTPAQVQAGASPRNFIADPRASVEAGIAAGKDLNAVYKQTCAALTPKYGHWVIFDHCMPFDVTRCNDEMTQYTDPRIWTAERDRQMWQTLES